MSKSPEKEVHVIMNDPLMKKKWDLQKTNVEEAWLKFSKGSRDIIVAVIDTGIDTSHPDLKKIYGKTQEKSRATEKMMTKTAMWMIYTAGILC